MTRHVTALLALALVPVLALGACGDARKALNDEAACPGATCTDDTRARFDTLAGLDRVTSVHRVERSYGFDRGSASSADLSARVADRTAAREVALAALGVLDDWPEAKRGPKTVSVTADPEIIVPYVSRETLDMSPALFDPCAGGCASALEQVRRGVEEEYDGVEHLTFEVAGPTLRVRAATTPDQVGFVAAAIRGNLIEVGARIASRAEIEVRARGPLVVEMRLDDGLVCEQQLGMHGCPEDELKPFDNS